jgi:hypothetical protein
MTLTDYIIDSLLVLLVLTQIKERELSLRALVRPLVLAGVAVANYLHGIPTAGNDLVLVGIFALLGSTIGFASGHAVLMRLGRSGQVLARSGWLSGFYWVLGMGSRFGFIFWITHTGHAWIGRFSAEHAITSGQAWTAALLAMAVCEVAGRSAVQAMRRHRLQQAAAVSALA